MTENPPFPDKKCYTDDMETATLTPEVTKPEPIIAERKTDSIIGFSFFTKAASAMRVNGLGTPSVTNLNKQEYINGKYTNNYSYNVETGTPKELERFDALVAEAQKAIKDIEYRDFAGRTEAGAARIEEVAKLMNEGKWPPPPDTP